MADLLSKHGVPEYLAFRDDIRRRYAAHMESIKDLPSIERAQAWLAFRAANLTDFGDAEAITYLRCLGRSCAEEIQQLVNMIKRGEEWSLAHPYYRLSNVRASADRASLITSDAIPLF